MDPLTQGLLGATTTQLGFRRKIGRDASWLAFLSALAPDLDVFSGPIRQLLGFDVNPFDSLIAHRSWSHSLLMVPLLTLPIAWIWWRIRSFLLNGKPGTLDSGRPVCIVQTLLRLYLGGHPQPSASGHLHPLRHPVSGAFFAAAVCHRCHRHCRPDIHAAINGHVISLLCALPD